LTALISNHQGQLAFYPFRVGKSCLAGFKVGRVHLYMMAEGSYASMQMWYI